jgi:phosphoribosylanthranilate isomerase
VRRDGTLTGPNVELLEQVCARPTARSSPAGECRRWRTCGCWPGLVPTGVEGAIVGKALYAGAFTLPEALAAVSE